MELTSFHENRKYSPLIDRLVKSWGMLEADNLKLPPSKSKGEYGGVPIRSKSPIGVEIIEGKEERQVAEKIEEKEQQNKDCQIKALSVRVGILLEYTEHESLKKYLLKKVTFPISNGKIEIDQKIVKWVATETAACLNAISNFGIIHRDVKADNFLVFHDGEKFYLKITDLGMARILGGPDDKARTLSSVINKAVFYPEHTMDYMFASTTSSFQWAELIAYELLALCCVDENGKRPGLELVWARQFRYAPILNEWRHIGDNMKIEFPDNVVCAFKWMKKNGREKELSWHDDNLFKAPIPKLIRETYKFNPDDRWHMDQVYKELLE